LSEDFVDPIRDLGRPRGEAPVGMAHERTRSHLDYVWYRRADGVSARGVYRVLDRAGSDHHPIVVDLDLDLDPTSTSTSTPMPALRSSGSAGR